MDRLKELWSYRKSFTVKVAIIGNALMVLLYSDTQMVLDALHTFIKPEMVDPLVDLATKWLPILIATGVVKGRVDADSLPHVSRRD